MLEIQTIDIIALIVLLFVIIISILLRINIKKKLKDIEGDSSIFLETEGEEKWIARF